VKYPGYAVRTAHPTVPRCPSEEATTILTQGHAKNDVKTKHTKRDASGGKVIHLESGLPIRQWPKNKKRPGKRIFRAFVFFDW